tara:strand:- start:248 stop:685 length:438 start_codon:yes stop_codon:yes gene_type:complete
MKKLFVFMSLVMFIVACQKFEIQELETLISTHDEDESHHYGENCMNCHYSAGRSEGVFTVGGSVSGNFKNATMEFYKDGIVKAVHKVEVDKLGNAYTTEDIDFSEGLSVGVRNRNGKIEFMDDKIFNGQCNLCHGTKIEEVIEID